mgnify:CR=1 FL=1
MISRCSSGPVSKINTAAQAAYIPASPPWPRNQRPNPAHGTNPATLTTVNPAMPRTSEAPFDWVQGGTTPVGEPEKAAEIVAPYQDVGVTWWVEQIDPWRFGLGWEDLLTPEVVEHMNARIRQGPPRFD